MFEITGLQPLFRYKNRISVELDGAPWAVLSARAVREHKLAVGVRLPESVQNLLLEEDGKAAMEKALWYLGQRAYSQSELEQKLKGYGFSQENRDNVMARMLEYGYINDEDLAQQAVRNLSGRSLSRRAMTQKLRARGLDGELVESALQELDPEDERSAAFQLAARLSRRYQSEEDPRKRREKITAALARKGFGWELIRAALDHTEGGEE